MGNKRQTKAQKFKDFADAIKCIKADKKPVRSTRKDGSVATRSTIPVEKATEADVLSACLSILKSNRIFANRLNNGKFYVNGSWHTYGIKGGGDILGLLPNGRHFEIECKAGAGGSLSSEQQLRQRDITESGGLYIVAHSAEEMMLQLRPHIPIKSFKKGLEQ